MLVTVGALVAVVGGCEVVVQVGASLSCACNCRGFGSFSWSQCC